MKITAIGLSHREKRHEILDCEFRNQWLASEPNWNVNRDTGEITFSWDKYKLSMRGNYEFSASLSREEIVRLFVSSMSDVPFDEVVRLLAESGKRRTATPTVAGKATEAVAVAA